MFIRHIHFCVGRVDLREATIDEHDHRLRNT